ncbi:MAG: type II secretion system minor pseudopilin GspI [Nevskiales bacterium]|nr:type II secretion system minor pseudopilin GspI [Nevskiales bacterium]
MKRPAAGFTLIEILVAVTVLAVALGALISGMTRHAANAAVLREKTVALWVAHNRLTEIALQPSWPDLGKSDDDVEMAGLEWRWFATVSETPDPDVRRVDIRVVRSTSPSVEEPESSLIQLSAFFSKP